MRKPVAQVRLAVLVACLALSWMAAAGEAALKQPLAGILPDGTIMAAEIRAWGEWSKDFSATSLSKIFQEPEVKAFLAGPFSQVSQLVRSSTAKPGEPSAAQPEPFVLAPVLDFLSNFTPGPFAVAVRFSAEDAQAKRAPAVAVLAGTTEHRNVDTAADVIPVLLENLKIKSVTVSSYQIPKGDTVKLIGVNLGKNTLTIALLHGRLLITNEDLFCKQIIDGLAGNLPKKLADNATYKNTGLTGDEHLMTYLDVAGLKAALGAAEKPEGAAKPDFLVLAGLGKSSAVAWSLKMNGPAFESRTAIFTTDEREGLLGTLAEEPVSNDALRLAPKDCPLAAGFRVRPDRVMTFVRGAIKAAQGQKGLDNFNAVAKQWNKDLGRDLEKEAQAALGNEFVLASLAGQENAGPFGGLSALAASVSLQDAKKTDDLLQQVLQLAAAKEDPAGKAENVLKQVEFEGRTIRYLTLPRLGGLIEFSPAFVVLENRLVMALDVPALKRALSVIKDGPVLTDSAAFRSALASCGGNMGPMFNYVDWAAVYKAAFNFTTQTVRLLVPAEALRQVGVDLNLVPRTEAVSQHLFPGLTLARVTPNGIVLSSRSPLPSLEVVSPPLAAITAAIASFRPFFAPAAPAK